MRRSHPTKRRTTSGAGNKLMISEKLRSNLQIAKTIWLQFAEVAKPYWTSSSKWKAFGLLAILLVLLLAVNGLNVVINYVAGEFMTALSAKNQPVFYKMLGIYFGVFVIGTPIVVLYSWMVDKLGLHWRTWLTEHMLEKYLANKNYYRLNNDSEIDNPDERIAQDVRDFTSGALSLFLNILSSVITFFSFMYILWSISHQMVGVVFAYALAGTIATVWMGRRLVGLKFDQLKKEANFRYNLIHVRNNVESIAFHQGEAQESKRISARFADAVQNFNALIGWQRNVGFLTTGYNYMIVLIPSLMIAPLYFAGKVPFGVQTQADMAFGQILSALSLVISSFESITGLIAQSKRLGSFQEALNKVPDNTTTNHVHSIDHESGVKLDQLTVKTPGKGQMLVKELSLAEPEAKRLLITGPSGTGKTSILRTIAGLWNSGTGTVERPALSDMAFLPQRPYMVLGSLREQLSYPRYEYDIDDEKLHDVLKLVNLAELPERVGGIDVEMHWPDVLSLGEQQRLSFARLLLSKAKYAVLDEATSALDLANEERLYKLLVERGLNFVSVGHRPSLTQYHDTLIELKVDGSWTKNSAETLRVSQTEAISFHPNPKANLNVQVQQ